MLHVFCSNPIHGGVASCFLPSRRDGCAEARSSSSKGLGRLAKPYFCSCAAAFRAPWVAISRGPGTKEVSPRTTKSVGSPNGPCGFLSASSRRDSRSVSADRRHPLRRIGRPKPKSPSLCHPSWLVRRSERLCGSGREERYALPGTWLKCQSSRDQGSLGGVLLLAGGYVGADEPVVLSSEMRRGRRSRRSAGVAGSGLPLGNTVE